MLQIINIMDIETSLANNEHGFFLANINIKINNDVTYHIVEINDANATNIFNRKQFKNAVMNNIDYTFRFCADDENLDHSYIEIVIKDKFVIIDSFYNHNKLQSTIPIKNSKKNKYKLLTLLYRLIDCLYTGEDEWFGKCYEAMCDD